MKPNSITYSGIKRMGISKKAVNLREWILKIRR